MKIFDFDLVFVFDSERALLWLRVTPTKFLTNPFPDAIHQIILDISEWDKLELCCKSAKNRIPKWNLFRLLSRPRVTQSAIVLACLNDGEINPTKEVQWNKGERRLDMIRELSEIRSKFQINWRWGGIIFMIAFKLWRLACDIRVVRDRREVEAIKCDSGSSFDDDVSSQFSLLRIFAFH